MSEAVLLRCPGSHVTLKQVANDPNPAQRGLKSPATEELQRANWNVFLLSISVFQHHKTSSVQFSRHEWVVSPFSRGSSNPGIEPRSAAWQADSLPCEPPGKPPVNGSVFSTSTGVSPFNRWLQKMACLAQVAERLSINIRTEGRTPSFSPLSPLWATGTSDETDQVPEHSAALDGWAHPP